MNQPGPPVNSAAPVQVDLTKAPGDRWRDLKCPLRGPRFPFGTQTKQVFQDYYVSRLEKDQEVFERYFEGTDTERSEANARLLTGLPEVAARDAWREAFTSYTRDLVFPPGLTILGVALVTPWIITDESWLSDVSAGVVGLFGAALLFSILLAAEILLEPRNLGTPTALLVILGLCAVPIVWLYAEQPTGWIWIIMPVLDFALIAFWMFLGVVADAFVIAVFRRRKIVNYLQAELADTLFEAMRQMISKPAVYTEVASSFDYMADIIEQNWRLFSGDSISPSMQPQLHEVAQEIAAGMRETALCAAFPTKMSKEGDDFDNVIMTATTSQMIAVTTLRYGDLPRAKHVEIGVRPRIAGVIRAIGSVIAAFAPIALLIVVPRVFDVEISSDLNGTLLTVSLAWLALYVVGWLDPQSLNQVNSMTGVVGNLKSGKRG